MLQNFLFKKSAIAPLLPESCRDHHRRAHTRVDTLANNLRHGLRRSHHQCEIDSSLNLSYVLVRFDPENFVVAGIHSIDFDRKLALQEIRDDAAADRTWAIGGSDHRD